jgi:hypothetical protein
MKCYEIANGYDQLQEMTKAILECDSDNAEMKDCLTIQMEQLNHDTSTKLENMAKMLKNMELEAEAYKTEIDRMKPRMESINKQVKYIKENLIKPIIQKSGKLKAGVFTLSLRKSSSVKILDKALLAPKYIREVTVISIDKQEIKNDLKTGLVKGAELVENESLQIK